MENRVGMPEALVIAQSVANFLLKIERYNAAIEFYKEVLTLAKIIENITSVSDGLILDIQEHTHLSLGYAYNRVGNHDESKANAKRALRISQKIGDKNVEQQSCYCLFWGFETLGRYDKAIKYLEKAVEICKAIGDSQTEAKYYYLLGKMYFETGQHEKATEYDLKSIEISKAIGQRKMEADALLHLGRVFADLGKLEESSQKQHEALRICEEIGDDSGRAKILTFLGENFQRKGQYDKSLEFLQNSLRVSREKHDEESEEDTCLYLGSVLAMQGNYQEAAKYLERVVEISNLTGNSEIMKIACNCLSNISLLMGQPEKAAEYKERAMKGLREAGPGKFTSSLAFSSIVTGWAAGNVHQELDVLAESIRFYESKREPLSDEYKLSLGERLENVICDKLHSYFLLKGGRKLEALLAAERGRARLLGEMLRKKYAIQEKIESVNESTLSSFVGSLAKEQVLVFLAALFPETPTETPAGKTFFVSWVMTNEEGPKLELFLSKEDLSKIRIRDLEDIVLGNFRSLVNGEDVECEDRSLSAFYDAGSKADDEEEGKRTGTRLVESDDEEDEENKKDTLLYDMLIAPIADRIESREVVLVPEGFMYMVPFPALQDGNGKYLSETCKIRIIPSLTTLKLIKDSTADYHSQAGALIVGDPDVSRVRGLGQLPAARQEAKEISELLNVSPLLGQQATKKEVLRRITDACLIHIAAHGDAERGEIACSPSLSSPRAPRKEDFMLTMSDIANVGIRAKLVVLSCCHSGRGKIMTSEGVVGIARAFITSGARSVLASLWLLNDESTREFMIRLYGHLVRDKMSTSEALHQSMKWMRESKKYSVSDWAPFVLIGDDVTLDL